jgi:hypothetical protein
LPNPVGTPCDNLEYFQCVETNGCQWQQDDEANGDAGAGAGPPAPPQEEEPEGDREPCDEPPCNRDGEARMAPPPPGICIPE